MYITGKSNIGKVLKINEDALIIKDLAPLNHTGESDYVIMIVADGNGSHPGGISSGALVANIVLDYIRRTMKLHSSINDLKEIINTALFTASRTMVALNGLNEEYKALYASITISVISKASKEVYVASVGNTETYLLRKGRLTRMIDLHTEAFAMMDKGEVKEEEYYTHPKHNVLTSAIGVFGEYQISSFSGKLFPEDVLFIMSDAVPNHITLGEMLNILSSETNLDLALDKVIDLINERGGYDNITLSFAVID